MLTLSTFQQDQQSAPDNQFGYPVSYPSLPAAPIGLSHRCSLQAVCWLGCVFPRAGPWTILAGQVRFWFYQQQYKYSMPTTDQLVTTKKQLVQHNQAVMGPAETYRAYRALLYCLPVDVTIALLT